MNNVKYNKNILEFEKNLKDSGYSRHVIPIYIRNVKRFLEYKNVFSFTKIDHLELKKIINEYMKKTPLTSQKSVIQASLHSYYFFITGNLFIWRLNLKEYDLDVAIESEKETYRKYLKEFSRFHNSTIISYCSTVNIFLYTSFRNNDYSPDKITFEHVYVYLSNTLSHLSKASKKTSLVRIRSYIRFLEFTYGVKSEKILKLPMTSPVWKRSSLPKHLTNLELEKLLSVYDRNKPYGIRDYAVARCLCDLGLRCSEVSGLSLDNFDWVKGNVTIHSTKSNSERTLPLHKITGESIETYLLYCRPKTLERTLFVRYKNETGKPMGTSQVRNTVRSAAIRARLDNFTGTHMLRHTAAAKMLNSGISIKTIADILGHESIETTCIYTKLDFTQLHNVAGVWPVKRI